MQNKKAFWVLVFTLYNACLTVSASPFTGPSDSLLDILQKAGSRMLHLPDENQRLAAADSIHSALWLYLQKGGAHEEVKRAVPNISVLQATDKRVTLMTYVVPRKGGIYEYHGILMTQTTQQMLRCHVLKDVWSPDLEEKPAGEPEFFRGSAPQWPGALIYHIEGLKHKDKTYYLLLGYRPQSASQGQKIIDVLTLDSKGLPRFGAPVFSLTHFQDKKFKRRPLRLFLRYNGQVSASVRWDPSGRRVLLDHLVPRQSEMKGFYSSYTPDLSTDALVWRKGKFHWEETIDVKSPVKPTRVKRAPQDGLSAPHQP